MLCLFFLWGDECQYFTLDYDQIFQTTARSSRTLTVYATQNLDNLYNGYGKEQANSLLGNLGTKIFCQNGDYNTNKWAADSIGRKFYDGEARTSAIANPAA
ncbi:MAG: TraG/TraD/VirD4 family protein [Lentisphaeria bacterium]|nr:MAG: TraG/TraD/VirD4 family protein [Lentisphaeria bacterium]